ncbi:hypothetical protein RUM44_000126 [Polyplax serrata]|uniref:Uncharacterized protein n=1 Tax=Polyplax serrata TaxID=468196 RepID=A0ABR1B4L7_POLSC
MMNRKDEKLQSPRGLMELLYNGVILAVLGAVTGNPTPEIIKNERECLRRPRPAGTTRPARATGDEQSKQSESEHEMNRNSGDEEEEEEEKNERQRANENPESTALDKTKE